MVLSIEKDVIILDNGIVVDKTKFLDWVAWQGYNVSTKVRPGHDGEPIETVDKIELGEWIDSISVQEFYATLDEYLQVRNPDGSLKDLPDLGAIIIDIVNQVK